MVRSPSPARKTPIWSTPARTDDAGYRRLLRPPRRCVPDDPRRPSRCQPARRLRGVGARAISPTGPRKTSNFRPASAAPWIWRSAPRRFASSWSTPTRRARPRILNHCTYPLTAPACVKRIYTNLAVIDVTPRGLFVLEMVPGMTLEALQALTEPKLQLANSWQALRLRRRWRRRKPCSPHERSEMRDRPAPHFASLTAGAKHRHRAYEAIQSHNAGSRLRDDGTWFSRKFTRFYPFLFTFQRGFGSRAFPSRLEFGMGVSRWVG